MRERTTWNREIARTASGRTAEDPRAMNQDHLQQQPAPDDYVTGGPSEFAEDVHPSTGTWKAEYEAGQTARNEIGMPEMRADTFKVAGLDEETLHKKAEVCIRVARQMLPGAKASSIEDQALALMHLPDVELIQTADRLAKKMSQEDEDEEGQEQGQQQGQQAKPQAKQAQDEDKKGQDEGDEPAQGQQQKQAALDLATAMQSGDPEKIQSAIDAMMQSAFGQQAQQQAPQQAPAPQQGGQQAQQQPPAQGQGGGQQQAQQQPPAQGQGGGQQQAGQQPPAQGQGGGQQQAGQQANQQAGQSGCGVTAEQVQKMVMKALQQAQQGQPPAPQAPTQQQAMQPPMSDDQLLDQMLMDQGGAPMPEVDVQLEGAPMDIGEVGLGPGDEVLSQLFASHQEVRQAAQAKALEEGVAPPTASPIRTASTRTVGTRPTGGVSQIGGATANTSGGNDIDKLSGLWRSAPDVSGIFNPEG